MAELRFGFVMKSGRVDRAFAGRLGQPPLLGQQMGQTDAGDVPVPRLELIDDVEQVGEPIRPHSAPVDDREPCSTSVPAQ